LSHFKPSEFDSPDTPGSGRLMDARFLAKVEGARAECGFPWNIVSGYRTPAHNKAVGGAPNSWHMKGKACDVRCRDGARRYAIVAAAIAAGIKGIEVCDGHVHLDDRPTAYLWPDKSK
jgi:uncharacterized protein YcbK (DUF882 family)